MVPFVTVQISDATYRWLLDAKDDQNKKNAAVSNGLFLLLISSTGFFVICMVASLFLHIQYMYYFIVILLLSGLLPFLQQVIRGLGNNKLYSFIGIANSLFLVIFNLIFILGLKMRLEGLLISTIIANIISILLISFKINLPKIFSFGLVSKKEMWAMLQYSWPLIPNMISWWLINEVNRFIILLKIGPDANGIFAISNRFPAIIIILNSIFMLSWQDHAIGAQKDEDKDAFYSKIFNVFMTLELSVVIFLTSISHYTVKYLIGPQFQDSWKYMPLLYLSVAFSSFAGFLGVGYLAAKKTRGIFTTSIISSVLNILISYLLIDKIGLYAPALGTLTGFVLMWLIRLYQTRHFFKLKLNYTTFFALLINALAFIVLAAMQSTYLDITLIIIAILILITCNKQLVKFIFGFISNRFNSLKFKSKAG
jgi:O-antigen/teichoic acid export membrane protein